MKSLIATVLAFAAASVSYALAEQQAGEPVLTLAAPASLTATSHPPLPRTLSQYWLVPESLAHRRSSRAREETFAGFARGVKAIAAGDFAVGLPLVSGSGLDESLLSDHAKYYRALALQGLSRLPEADSALTDLAASRPVGVLAGTVRLKLAEVVLARHDARRARDLLQALIAEGVGAPEDLLLRLGQAEEELDHSEQALDAYRKIYVSFPASSQAADAKAGIDRLSVAGLGRPSTSDELARAERLFTARRWADARAAFESIAGAVSAGDRPLVAIRMAECDEHLGRHRAARDRLKPYLSGSSHDAEVRFFYLSAVRGMGDRAAYVALARALADDAPASPWAIEALNDLASFYVIGDEDAEGDAVFRQLLERYPTHRYAERAAWKVGWAAYRSGRFADAATVFESAAAQFPRADLRPAWIYWSGRARDRIEDRAGAAARYNLAMADYGSSYYGRLAARMLTTPAAPDVAASQSEPAAAPAKAPPTESLMKALMAAGLFDDALREVQYAQRTWGDSPQLQATAAWIRYQQAQDLRGDERFAALRGAINTMRRAYPQFLSAQGEALPPEVLRIIFPLDYWELVEKYSSANGLDPYLVAALMAQESTFTAEIRSSANARGLMQVMPATGRMYARKLGIRPFSTASLSQPEVNVKIGARFFRDMMDRFGGAHYALAGYNAGDARVAAWIKASPDLPPDEFVDSIPFPETQNYVKRILGTAEDYRRLYGSGLLAPNQRLASAAAD